MRLTTTLSFLCLTAAGCTLGVKDRTEDEFCQEYARRECAKVATLCTFAPASCEPVRTAACRQRSASSKTGARQYSAGAGDKCLDAVDKAYATVPIDATRLAELAAACERVFQGQAASREACTVDYDCAGELTCEQGRCATRKVVAANEGCANLGETCPRGQFCAREGLDPVCTKRQDSGAACSDARPCLEDFRCTGTCTAKLEAAATCAASDECKSGYCNEYPPAGSPRKCSVGLNFSEGSSSCQAFMGASLPDAGPTTSD
jgi:hypothetical protein